MKIKNETLFTIVCRHPFYADGRCRGLALRPTGACRKLLRRYDLLFHETGGGGMVSYAQKEGFDPLLSALDTPVTFTFALTSTDPDLLNFTEISLPRVFLTEQFFYFSNLGGHVRETGALCLHRGPTASAKDQVAVHSALFTGTIPDDENPQIVRHLAQTIAETPEAREEIAQLLGLRQAVLDGNAGAKTFLQVFNQFGKNVWDAALTPGQDYTVDLSSRPPGRYRMTKGKKPASGNGEIIVYDVHDFYTSPFPPEQVWGLVEIVVAGPGHHAPIPEAFRLFDRGAIRPLDFEIGFENRATFWRYYVMNPSPDNPPPADATVSGTAKTNGNGKGNSLANGLNNGRETILFESAEDQIINGQKARVFESQKPIRLWEAPAGKYTFSFNGRALPYAGTALIKTEAPLDHAAAEDPKIYSEIFVYL